MKTTLPIVDQVPYGSLSRELVLINIKTSNQKRWTLRLYHGYSETKNYNSNVVSDICFLNLVDGSIGTKSFFATPTLTPKDINSIKDPSNI